MVEVIGLGTQDSAEEAAEFVERGGTHSFPMYWDETFESWEAFGIASQPAAALLAPDGELLAGWLGAFDQDEVLRIAAELAG
ncbi:MAG: hypothetical protein R8G01_13840 [Ilumatobacteraceae bacterium]|nr:hypothetical protein [Ilumatobacteraceae bacterium]